MTTDDNRERCPRHPINYADDCGACWATTPRPMTEWESMLAPYGGLAGILPPLPEPEPAAQLHPGVPEAIGAALRSLLKLGWVWLRGKTRRKPAPTFHEAWCPDDGTYCECWRFLLESDPTAERFMTEYDDDQRRDR